MILTMVKVLNITMDDEEFKELEKAKGKLTWREFMDNIIKDNIKKEEENDILKENKDPSRQSEI